MSLQEVRVAVLGAGTVGSQVIRLLGERAEDFAQRSGARLVITGIGDRKPASEQPPFIDTSLLTDDLAALATSADLVIELIGGIEPARTLVLAALDSGASVVTANKALLATHGPELLEAAARSGADLYYEAAVAGAVPVVYALRESLAGDTVTRVLGIVNGTTNFILDEMATKGLSFDEALATAQELGYAEANPTADVDGLDAAAKAALLASLAFHTRVSLGDVVAAAAHRVHGGNAPRESAYANLRVLGPDEVRTAQSIRLRVVDEVGVLAAVAGIFAEGGISFESVRQVPSEHDATISIVTHVARAGDLARTVEALRANPAVRE